MIYAGINNEYFEWLLELLREDMYVNDASFRKLLRHLHRTEFTYIIPNDANRAEDGISLRYRFSLDKGFDTVPNGLDGPCSVLEMMVALALRCEENYMDDPTIGDRTSQWFWMMINNLGLSSMYDSNYKKQYVDDILERFLNRDYEPDGTGGLIKIKRCKYDLRNYEIWDQLCWYINTLI